MSPPKNGDLRSASLETLILKFKVDKGKVIMLANCCSLEKANSLQYNPFCNINFSKDNTGWIISGLDFANILPKLGVLIRTFEIRHQPRFDLCN